MLVLDMCPGKEAYWAEDSKVFSCYCCGDPFSFKFRKHHCRACGSVVCEVCSMNRIAIPRYGYLDPTRICQHCFALAMIRTRGGQVEDYVDVANRLMDGDESKQDGDGEFIGLVRMTSPTYADRSQTRLLVVTSQ